MPKFVHCVPSSAAALMMARLDTQRQASKLAGSRKRYLSKIREAAKSAWRMARHRNGDGPLATRSMQPEFAADGLDLGGLDQPGMRDRHRMPRPFDGFPAASEKALEPR